MKPITKFELQFGFFQIGAACAIVLIASCLGPMTPELEPQRLWLAYSSFAAGVFVSHGLAKHDRMLREERQLEQPPAQPGASEAP